MHLQHETGLGPDRLGIVPHAGAVGGADFAQPRTGGRQQLGDAEAVADFDEFAAAEHDFLARGQREGGQ